MQTLAQEQSKNHKLDKLLETHKISHRTADVLPLYIVVREDLSPGQQIAQVAHAMAAYAKANHASFHSWEAQSNYLIVLGWPHAMPLTKLQEEAMRNELTHHSFKEPDFNHEITALVFEPHEACRKFLKKLPLAGGSTSKAKQAASNEGHHDY